MKADGGGLLGFVIAQPSFSLMKLSKVYLLCCSVSELILDMLRGRIYFQGIIIALEVGTVCNISLPSLLRGPRTLPRHYFAAGDEFGVL